MYVYSIKPRPHNILLVLTPPLPLSKTKPFSEKSESQIIIFCENTDTHHQRINWYLPYAIKEYFFTHLQSQYLLTISKIRVLENNIIGLQVKLTTTDVYRQIVIVK